MGFDSVYRDDGSEVLYSTVRIIATSLEQLEFARRYPAHMVFVGPVLYSPPAALPDPPFVPGRPHVLVTLGTHLVWRRDHVAAAVRQAALELPGVEFHFSEGDRSSDRHESSANFHRMGFVSYEAHLKRYDVVVHHGGTGVLGFTLAAGTPSVVHPLDYDHFDNCARLEAAGVALRLTRLPDLARLICQALVDLELRAAVAQLQGEVLAAKGEEHVALLVEAEAVSRTARHAPLWSGARHHQAGQR
jgi:UDP:flavonoid glycosyltransferase YjiC (YdhE family)